MLGVLAFAILQTTASGPCTPELKSLDHALSAWVVKDHIPGAVLCVVAGNRLIHARGYGYANAEKKTPFLPSTPFRYGSVGKWFTAMAYAKLAEEGHVNLDQSIVSNPASRAVLPPSMEDPKWMKLTYRALLTHKSGLRQISVYGSDGDGVLLPLSERVKVGLARGFEDGPMETYRYSGFNYMVAAYLFPSLAGKPLDTFLQEKIFGVAGVKGISPVGQRREGRLKNESEYYVDGDTLQRSIWKEDNAESVGAAYRANLRADEGFGGYRGSALELARLAMEFSWQGSRPPLKADSVKQMLGWSELLHPPVKVHGLGIESGSDFANGFYWEKGGMTPGMSTNVIRRSDGTVIVFAFNRNNDLDPGGGEMLGAIFRGLDAIPVKPSVDFWSAAGN